MSRPTRTGWHPAALFSAHLIALLLMGSWLLEPTRSLWLALDQQLFWAMNSSLEWSRGWQQLWAVANNRAFDLVAGFSMLLLFIHHALVHERKRILHYLSVLAVMFFVLLVLLLISKELPVERPSATARFPEALRLSQLVPEIPTKDYSSDSFPGDHGLVLLICAGYALAYLPAGYGLLALLFMVLFTLPRLMSGAHWVTDEIVGAVSVGLPALAWLFATPLQEKLLGAVERRVGWLEKKLLRRGRLS